MGSSCPSDGRDPGASGSTTAWPASHPFRDNPEAIERQLLAGFDKAVLGIAFADLDGRLFAANPAFCEIYGRAEAEIIGHRGEEFAHPDNPPSTNTPAKAMAAGLRDRFGTETRIVKPDGPVAWVRTDIVVVPGADGQPGYLFDQVRDITERQHALAALTASEARSRHLLDQVVATVAAVVEVRDPYIAGHQRRVAQIAERIGARLGLDEDSRQGLSVAATIHDVGKIGVPADILMRPGPLTTLEFALVKQHSQIGHDIAASIEFPWPVATMILQHHERIDGSGYPHGITGPDILLGSRILAVADCVEAAASHRPYRPALGVPAALDIIRSERGRTLDSDAVDACLAAFASGEVPLDVSR